MKTGFVVDQEVVRNKLPCLWPFLSGLGSGLFHPILTAAKQHFFIIGVSHTALSVLSDRSRVWEVNIYGLWGRDKRVLTI